MKKEKFHTGWTVEKGIKDPFASMMPGEENAKDVTLPHDAMIFERRSEQCANGTQTGYYPCGSYTYLKKFTAPDTWREQQVLLEFEGVMKKAMVYLNGELAGKNSNGYSQFYIDPKLYLRYGQENEIKVLAINEDKSSRWYPGSGIYRDVNLYIGGSVSIMPEGIRITTEDRENDYAVICIDIEVRGNFTGRAETKLEAEIIDPTGKKVTGSTNTVTVAGEKVQHSHMRMTVSNPSLWSPDHPVLYRCCITARCSGQISDVAETEFGIRTLQLDARQGIRINGRSIKLRGACIHHDNGVIGACTLESAEMYRCRKLKEAGFNSIRSSHNPMSKAMLAACDKLGMLVMDELSDVWDTPKNSNDFSFDFGTCWKEEVRRMVSKDYNHPSVILYSVGNEIPECGTNGGRLRNREIACLFRDEDHTRFVTCGINGFLALSGISEEEKRELVSPFMPDFEEGNNPPETSGNSTENRDPNTASIQNGGVQKEQNSQEDQVETTEEGSEKLNDVMGDIPFEMRDILTGSSAMTRQLCELEDEMDVIGLNYMPARHVLEHERNKDHIIMGSESYPTEIARLWKIVKENPFVIGDFTWTGYDYLGEAGIGSYHYDAMPQGQGSYPDRLAYCGDINLNGYRRPISYLREIVYGLRKDPYISVERVDRYGYGCLRNHWKTGDEVASWTFPGYEGKPAKVKIFSPSEEVELLINGNSVGRKPAGENHEFTAEFETVYTPGSITAVGYTGGKETGRCSLRTAGKPKRIRMIPSTDHLRADGRDALILEAVLVDEHGTENMWEKKIIKISVDGPAYLAGFGNANPSGEECYQSDVCETYDGRVIAVIRTAEIPGPITVRLEGEGVERTEYHCSSN